MIKNHRKWQDISEEERQEKAEEYFTEVTDQYKNGLLQDTFRSRHMMQTMKRVLNRTIKTISNQMGDGEFETIGNLSVGFLLRTSNAACYLSAGGGR